MTTKRILLLGTVLVGGPLLLASPVRAGGIEASIGGDMEFQVGLNDQDVDLPDRGYDFRTSTEIEFEFRGQTDDGLRYGAEIQLEVDQGGTENADEVWTWLEGDWGRIQLGDQDGADSQMAYSAGLTQAATGGIDGDVDDWFNNVGEAVSAPEIEDASDDTKITYYTPRVFGIQLGASLTPQTNSEGQNVANDDPQVNDDEFENHIGLGVNYQDSLDDLDFGVSLTGGFANAVNENFEDFASWALGGYVAYGDLSLAASYGDNGDTRGEDEGSVDDDFYFGIGVGYEWGAWEASVGYLHSEFRQGDADDEFDNFTVSGGVEYAPGLYAYVELMLVSAESSLTEDNDGTVLMIGNIIDF